MHLLTIQLAADEERLVIGKSTIRCHIFPGITATGAIVLLADWRFRESSCTALEQRCLKGEGGRLLSTGE